MIGLLLGGHDHKREHGDHRYFRFDHRPRATAMRGHEVVEHLEDLTRTGWPIVGVLLETTFDEHGQGLGDICSFCRDRRRHVDDVGANQRCDRTGKGRLPRDHLVGNAAERVEIDPVVEPCICGGLLGRHVERCSNHNSQVGPRRRNGHCMRSQQGLGDSKIRNGGGIAGEQDVVWLDVPVHDTFGVRELQRARDVSENADRYGNRHGARTHEMHPERLPFDERHRVVGQPFRLSGREHRQDVWVLQLGGEQYLVLETLKIHAGREIGRKHFHHDTTTERALLRQKHATHSTAAEFAFYAIGAGQRGLQPISKIGLQVLNLRFEQSREEGRYVRSTLTATGRALPRRAHPRRPDTR